MATAATAATATTATTEAGACFVGERRGERRRAGKHEQ
jgi:hypothetical protein